MAALCLTVGGSTATAAESPKPIGITDFDCRPSDNGSLGSSGEGCIGEVTFTDGASKSFTVTSSSGDVINGDAARYVSENGSFDAVYGCMTADDGTGDEPGGKCWRVGLNSRPAGYEKKTNPKPVKINSFDCALSDGNNTTCGGTVLMEDGSSKEFVSNGSNSLELRFTGDASVYVEQDGKYTVQNASVWYDYSGVDWRRVYTFSVGLKDKPAQLGSQDYVAQSPSTGHRVNNVGLAFILPVVLSVAGMVLLLRRTRRI